ncbi:MAG TPA: ABC transporter substrate-binding protein [Dongiaceae bacterium]|nr:ABC transporter substrate-binding protein [Dongiaceae bacterium]
MSESTEKLKLAEKLVGRGKVSRRQFVQLALAAGFTAAAAETLFVKAARAEPKRGGSPKFGLAHGATTDTLDPAGYPDTGTQIPFSGSMSSCLTEVDVDGNIQPDLAESFEPGDDASTWIFKLRKGATFHNGKSVTPDDVIASFQHHMGPDSKSGAKSLLNDITEIKGDGPDTVVFKLKSASADFPYVASDYHIVIMPAKDGKADWQSGIRTGAFVFGEYEPGVRAHLTRNPSYYKEGKPYFDDVEFLTIGDVTARTAALTAGQVQWIGRADLKTLSLLKRDPNVNIEEVTGFGHYTLPMRVTEKPFDNVDVRTALKYALNRQDVVDKIFLGHAKIGNDNPIAPTVKFAIDPEPKHTYDPDKAKFHLKKAGMENLKVDLSVADAAFNGAVDAAVLYQQHAKAAGIDINVVREPNDGYWDNVWLKKPWCASYWSGRPTCDWMFSTAYAAGAAWNEANWSNPRFNELLAQGRAETDEKKRAAIYAEMQQLQHDDGGGMVIVFNNYVAASSKKVAHGKIAGNWEGDGLKLAERWWIA